MQDIYVRHRPRCRFADADFQDGKGRPARQMFGCGCPIYARLEIRDPVTKDILFQHNGSLKGITEKEAAEELVNTWFVKYLSGETPAAHKRFGLITHKKGCYTRPIKNEAASRVVYPCTIRNDELQVPPECLLRFQKAAR